MIRTWDRLTTKRRSSQNFLGTEARVGNSSSRIIDCLATVILLSKVRQCNLHIPAVCKGIPNAHGCIAATPETLPAS